MAAAIGFVPGLPLAVLTGGMMGLTSGRVTSVTTLCTLGLAPILVPGAGVTVAVWALRHADPQPTGTPG